MNRFFGYIRVSTVKQGERGVSLQEQRDGIIRYAARNNLQIVAWFEERVTAAKQGRPLFSEMLRRLRKGDAEGVIIHKIDRSARNFKDWTAIEELADKGIAVHFVSESLDLRSTGGRLAADVQAVVAAHYIRNLREETKKGLYGRFKQGIYCLGAPVGYLDRGGGKPKEIDPVKGPLVRRAFELYASGRYNLRDLRVEITRAGLTNRSDKPLTLSGFSWLLNNPFYMGIIKLRKTGEVFQGIHEPIVSAHLFERVKAVLEGRVNARTRSAAAVLRRLVACRNCGYKLIGERQKGHVYYRCHTPGCMKKCLREEYLLDQIGKAAVEPIHLNEGELAEARQALSEMRHDLARAQASERDALKLRLGQIGSRMARLTDALLDGLVEKDLFEERKASLLIERAKLEEATRALEAHPASSVDRVQQFLELCGTAKDLFKLATGEEKRDLVVSIASNFRADAKQLEITWATPFHLIANRESVHTSALQRNKPRTWTTLLQQLLAWFRENPNGALSAHPSRTEQDRQAEKVAA